MSSPSLDPKLVQELLNREACRKSLEAWFVYALRDLEYRPAAHHIYLMEHLEQVARGEIMRLMVTMSPGHGKSIVTSQLFPAWLLAQKSNYKVIGASHTASLAEDVSTKVRGFIADNAKILGYDLRDDSKSRERWKTNNRGEYLSASTGKKIAGARANILIIDDPVGSRAEAESKVESEKLWSWYQNDAKTRLLPGSPIVLCNTRWSVNDLAGRLLEQEPEKWTVINLPALAEDDDPLGRAVGEPLWPEYFNRAYLDDMRAGFTARDWASLYQQRPRPEEGSLFKPDAIRRIETQPDGLTVRAWDLASSTSNYADWTVGIRLTRCLDGSYHIGDVIRFRGSPEEVERRMVQTAEQDGPSVVKIIIPQDPGAAGKMAARYLTKALAGYRVEAIPQSGDKISRAGPVVSQTNISNLTMAYAAWNEPFLNELAEFPNGRHDDQVDALATAFNAISTLRKPAAISRLNFMGR